MKILVIGGTGIIGTGLVEAACRAGHEVVAVSRQIRPIHDISLDVKYFQADWRIQTQAVAIMSNIDVDVIVDGLVFNKTQLIRDLELAKGHCKQYIYISTTGVYERPACKITEDAPKNPKNLIWSYSIEKRKAELYLESHYDDYPFMISTIRPPLTYGDTRIPCAMVGRANQYTLLDRILQGKPIVFIQDNSVHTVTHISTFSDAVVGMFMNVKVNRRMFHVSDDESYTWDDVIKIVGEILGVKPLVVHIPVEMLKSLNRDLYKEIKYNKSCDLSLDNSAIKKISPSVCYKVPLKQGLKSTIKHLCENYADKPLDKDFNDLCDILLLNCNSLLLQQNEQNWVKTYVDAMSFQRKQQLKKIAVVMRINSIKRSIKQTVKNIIFYTKR